MLQHKFFVWWSEFVLRKKKWQNSCLTTSIGTVSLQWQRIHSFPSFFDVPSNMQAFGFLVLWTLCPFHLQIFRMEVTWRLIYIVANWIVWWRKVKSLREVKYFLLNFLCPLLQLSEPVWIHGCYKRVSQFTVSQGISSSSSCSYQGVGPLVWHTFPLNFMITNLLPYVGWHSSDKF
jgi:hypothetical protein